MRRVVFSSYARAGRNARLMMIRPPMKVRDRLTTKIIKVVMDDTPYCD